MTFVLYNKIWVDKDISYSKPISRETADELLKKGGLVVRNTYEWTSQ